MTDKEIDDLYPDAAEFWATPPRRSRAATLPATRLVEEARAALRAVDAERAAEEARARVACLACDAPMDATLDTFRICSACRADAPAAIARLNARLAALADADAEALTAWEARLDALDDDLSQRWLSAVAALQAAERRLSDALADRQRNESRDAHAARLRQAREEVERWRRKFAKTRDNAQNPLSRVVVEHDAHLAGLRERQEQRALLLSARAILKGEMPF